MDWDRLAGDWSNMGARIRKDWGKLTEEDISKAGGRRDLLLERIRERYGIGPDEAERQLQEWASSEDTQNSGQTVR
ncbi:CsbD family protein [Roseomonas chloroacetimidivorans]|uniref:CsbD family protein n=1 Tax=Roseomonas chloroacetimidivorans TaxID=1766656 RepID=UPI003C76E47E